jgi:hypothetical protein
MGNRFPIRFPIGKNSKGNREFPDREKVDEKIENFPIGKRQYIKIYNWLFPSLRRSGGRKVRGGQASAPFLPSQPADQMVSLCV